MGNKVKIIGHCRKGSFRGQICFNDEPFHSVFLEGEAAIPWRETLLSDILANERVDTETTDCRFLITSDAPLHNLDFPASGNTSMWGWSDVVSAVRESGLQPKQWKLNDKYLKKQELRTLPHRPGSAEWGYLYTMPGVTPPDQDQLDAFTKGKKKIPGENHLPGKEKAPAVRQIICPRSEQKQTPLSENGTEMAKALEIMARKPKH